MPVADFTALRDRFQPLFDEIVQNSIRYEDTPALAQESVKALLAAEFGKLRLPAQYGGLGASLPESFSLLRDLATADSNFPQIFSAHFAFVETLARYPDRAGRWAALIRDGKLFGAAMAERSDETGIATHLTADGDGWRLNGTKYYSTGTLYADWIIVWATQGEDRVHVLVPADAPGVTRLDDWDGFGQRLTGSGTTVFDNVRIADDQIFSRTTGSELPAPDFLAAYYQQFHLVALAGITRAVLRDALDFVRPRTRIFGIPGKTIQREDPIVQGVIGRLSALAFSTETLTDRVSEALAAAEPAWRAGENANAAFEEVGTAAFKAQQIIIPQALEAATLLFEVGGASATSTARALDRHWRNARVLSSHNPAAQRQRELGDLALNGTPLWTPYREGLKRQQARLKESA